MVCVGALEQLPLDVLLEGVDQVAVVSYINRDHTEGLLLRVAVGAALANLLIGKRAAEHFAHHLLLPDGLERLVQALHQTHEKLDGVLLLAQVHRLPLKPENNQNFTDTEFFSINFIIITNFIYFCQLNVPIHFYS